jgi:hypothetical protein
LLPDVFSENSFPVKKEHPSAKASRGMNVRSDFIRVAMMGTVHDGK